jgi:hypothetical protein
MEGFLNKSTLHDGIYKRSNGVTDYYDVSTNNENSILQLEFNQSMFKLNPDMDAGKILAESKKRDLIITEDDKIKIHKIKQELYFLKNEFIYNQICDSARVIPRIQQLQEKVSSIYSIRILKNVINLKQYSPLFYTQQCKVRENFIVYQVLIYLCVLILYVYENRNNDDFIRLDSDITKIIEWVQCRNLPDLNYIVIGPTSNTNYQIDYKSLYKYLISPANSALKYGDNITEYMQLMSLRTIENILTETDNNNINRPNSYNKLQNTSEAFLIYFDTDYGCEFEENSNGDLIINCQNIEVGNVSDAKLNWKYDEKVNTNKLINIDPKTGSGQLNQLLLMYNTIKINKLLITDSTFQTSLNLYEKLYVIFPNIFMYTRTNQIFHTGTLQIGGKFKLNEQNVYEFIPDRPEGISYKDLTSHVKKIDFYISDKPNQKSTLVHYKPVIKYSVEKIFNIPILFNNKILAKNNDNYIMEFYYFDNNDELQHIKRTLFIYNKTYSIIQFLNVYNETSLFNITYLTYAFDFNYTSDMDYSKNKFKAYRTTIDILNDEWYLSDYLLSLGEITNNTSSLKLLSISEKNTFLNMNLTPIYDTEEINESVDNYLTCDFYYYMNRLLNTKPVLTINTDSSEINSILASINDDPTKYMIQKINNYIIQIYYSQPINDNHIILHTESNIKMTLELL